MNFQTELLESVKLLFEQKQSTYKADRTYKSVVKRIHRKGYVILDQTGNERTVKCCIPGVTLRVGQGVFVKEPMGDLQQIHICGIPDP